MQRHDDFFSRCGHGNILLKCKTATPPEIAVIHPPAARKEFLPLVLTPLPHADWLKNLHRWPSNPATPGFPITVNPCRCPQAVGGDNDIIALAHILGHDT